MCVCRSGRQKRVCGGVRRERRRTRRGGAAGRSVRSPRRRTTAMNEDEMQLAQALAKMSGPRIPVQTKLKNKLQGFR